MSRVQFGPTGAALLVRKISRQLCPSQLEAGNLLTDLFIFGDNESVTASPRRQHVPSSSKTSPKNPGEPGRARVLWIYVTRLDHISFPIRDWSLIVLEQEHAEAAAAGVPPPISSNPPSKCW